MTPTADQWTAYYLFHHDHRGMSYEEVAEEMGIEVEEVEHMIQSMRQQYPDLFTDINSNGRRFDHGVVRYGPGMDWRVKNKF